jgi:hypothetical protein
MRKVLVAILALVVSPIIVAGAVLAAAAVLDEVFSLRLNPFDFREVGWLDWLAAGPGAGPSSFQNFASFMIGGLAVTLPGSIVLALWGWASPGPDADADGTAPNEWRT